MNTKGHQFGTDPHGSVPDAGPRASATRTLPTTLAVRMSCSGAQVDNEFPITTVMSVLPQEDALPGSQQQPASIKRDRQLGRRQGALDMRRHVVRTFKRVGVEWIALRHQSIQPVLQVIAYVGITVFLYQQTCRCVTNEEGAKAVFRRRFCQ